MIFFMSHRASSPVWIGISVVRLAHAPAAGGRTRTARGGRLFHAEPIDVRLLTGAVCLTRWEGKMLLLAHGSRPETDEKKAPTTAEPGAFAFNRLTSRRKGLRSPAVIYGPVVVSPWAAPISNSGRLDFHR